MDASEAVAWMLRWVRDQARGSLQLLWTRLDDELSPDDRKSLDGQLADGDGPVVYWEWSLGVVRVLAIELANDASLQRIKELDQIRMDFYRELRCGLDHAELHDGDLTTAKNAVANAQQRLANVDLGL